MSCDDLNKKELIEVIEKLNVQIEELGKKISELVTTDGITNVYNRKELYRILEYEATRAERNNSYLSVLLLCVVDYDAIKDRYGEEMFNLILIQITRLIKRTIRSIDIIGRYEDDKFMLILPDINPNKGGVVADRIKKVVDKEIFPDVLSITICKGLKTKDGMPLIN